MNEYFSLGYFISENPLIKQRPYFENFKLNNSISILENKVNGKIFELLGLLIKVEERNINNKKAMELFLDEWGTFNLLIFNENEFFDKEFTKGETYIMTVIHSVDNERHMRLRFKSIRETNDFIEKIAPFIKIYIDNLNQIKKLKSKLNAIQKGKNNVILIYNGYEVDTGIKLDIKDIPFRDINQLDGITI